MDRYGKVIHISSMTAFSKTPSLDCDVPGWSCPVPPWTTHLSKTCTHQETKVRLKKFQPSGVVQARRQCTTCGQAVGSAVSKAAVYEQWDYELEESVRSEYSRLIEEYRDELNFEQNRRDKQREERDAKWWETYDAYLHSAIWEVKRTLVFRRCGGMCEACGQATAQQVHHLKYPDTLGLEPLWDLRAVCMSCHKSMHPHMR